MMNIMNDHYGCNSEKKAMSPMNSFQYVGKTAASNKRNFP